MNLDPLCLALLVVAFLVLAPVGRGRRIVVMPTVIEVSDAGGLGCLTPLAMIAGILVLLWAVF